ISFCRMATSPPRDLIEGSSLATLVQMVASGIGVTLIPEMAVPVETRSADVSVARLAAPRPTRTVGMVWRRTHPLADQLEQISRIFGDAEWRKGKGAAMTAVPLPGETRRIS
ncbi:MAG: hypothetical protein KDF64_09135, partial [Geminicoccaceae bacterium]|nr:hypothetical protein [Geminicoccaceae bacterium]